MIEVVSGERCISCGRCVEVCPTNVFDMTEENMPFIARKSDCQTCFMCELYCPVDALYVAPACESDTAVDEADVASSGLIGSYRKQVGWGKGRQPGASADASYLMFKEMMRRSGH